MDLLLIRHGLPERVELEPGQRADPALAPEGLAQAEAVGRWLTDEGIDAVYASPLRRAVQTAQPLAAALGLDVRIADGVAEYDRDANSYVPVEELRASGDPRWEQMLAGDYFADAAETAVEFQARVVAQVEAIIAAHPSQRVVVACHAGVINAWFGHVVGIDDFMVMLPAYTGIHRYACARTGARSIVAVNETGHLRVQKIV